MWEPGRILVVEDDRTMRDEYEMTFVEEGYQFFAAESLDQARDALRQRWEVVILDQKLQGSQGPDSGLELIEEATLTGARVIVVTAFATEDAILRAYQRGVYDYLKKDSPRITLGLLKQKVRRAINEVRAERAASQTFEERESRILDLWTAVYQETRSARKGQALEDLLLELFRSVPGFHVHPRQRNSDEEFDLAVLNRAPGWEKESEIILVEAKNWSSKVGTNEYSIFYRKLESRHGRCRLGFLVAANGFTKGVYTMHQQDRSKDALVVLVDRTALEMVVRTSDRGQALNQLRFDSIVKG